MPTAGEVYRHFKGNYYKIVTCAVHTESGERLVIYESMSDGKIWARPYDDFMSGVDREKYPNADQGYRFKLVEDGECHNGT